VMNKGDLLDAESRARVRAEVEAQLPRAVKVVETAHGAIDPRILLGLNAGAESDLASRPSHHETEDDHDHDDFESAAVPVRAAGSPDDLAARVARAAEVPGVLRIKGFCAVADKPMRLVVQGVGRRVAHHYDRPWRPGEHRDGRLVVIGLRGFDRDAVTAALTG
jgi:cobalamin biosynthesis protein CobW